MSDCLIMGGLGLNELQHEKSYPKIFQVLTVLFPKWTTVEHKVKRFKSFKTFKKCQCHL